MSALTPVTIVFAGGPGTVTQLDADLLGNKYLQGLRDVVLDGRGGGYQVKTGRSANTDDRFERPFNTAGLDENNGRSFTGKVEFTSGDLVQAVAKGSTTLAFTIPGAGNNAARWRVGTRFRLQSEDSEAQDRFTGAMGYPNACTKVERVLTVVEILDNGNGLRFTPAAEFDHFTDVRDWPTDWGGTGLPRATSLDRTPADGFDGYTLIDNLEVTNWTFLPPANGGHGYFINPARNFKITNCDVHIYNQFSQMLDLCTSIGNTYRAGCENDKDITELVSTNDKYLGIEPYTNGRFRRLTVTGGFFETGHCMAGRRQEFSTTAFTAGPVLENGTTIYAYGSHFPQPGHKPVDLLIYRAGQTFTSHPDSTAPAHIEYAPHDFYTVTHADESSDLLVYAPAWTPETAGQPTPGHDLFRTTCVGMCLSTVDGSKSGHITHRAWDEPRDCYVFSGTWERFEAGDVLVYSYVRNLVDEGGHTVDDKPLFNRNSLRFQGNTGTAGSYSFYTTDADVVVGTPTTQIPVFGTVARVTVNVVEAGPAGSFLDSNNYPMATVPDGSASRRICRIDMTQVGIRSFTSSQASGTKGTDAFDLSAIGWTQAFDFYRPVAGGKVLTLIEWSNDEAPLDTDTPGLPYTLPFTLAF